MAGGSTLSAGQLVLTQGSSFDFTGLAVQFNSLCGVNPADSVAAGGLRRRQRRV